MNKLKLIFSVKGVLLFVSSLILCYARHILQYNSAPWKNGFVAFIGSWLAHYFAIAFIVAIVLITLIKFGKYIFPNKNFNFEQNIEELIVYVSLTIIAASILALFLYYCGPFENDLEW